MILAIIDVETTGFDPSKDHLVEVALLRYDTELGVIDIASVLHDHGQDETGCFEVHGIEHDLVEQFGVPQVAKHLPQQFDICVAHNAEFDRKWLSGFGPWADTMDFEWPRKPLKNSLADLALAHGVGIVAAHRAFDDVLTIARVLDRSRELGADINYLVERALRPKATMQALVSYDDRELAKQAGFHWEPETKRWLKRMFVDDVPGLSFPARVIPDAEHASR